MKNYIIIFFKDSHREWDLENDLGVKVFTTVNEAKEQLNKDIEIIKASLLDKIKDKLNSEFDEDEEYIKVENKGNVVTIYEADSDDYCNLIIKETELIM